MKESLNVVLVTRFNLTRGANSWTDRRTELFWKWCAPGVQAQERKPDAWVLLVDAATNDKRLSKIKRDMDCIQFVKVLGHDPLGPLNGWIRENVTAPWVMTVRMDNDDTPHPRYIADLADAAKPQVEVLCTERGWVAYQGKAWEHKWRSTWVGLVEPNNGTLDTVYCRPHPQLFSAYSYRRVAKGQGRWLAVMHGENKSGEDTGERAKTRSGGHEVHWAQLAEEFPGVDLAAVRRASTGEQV